jgi:hypothetical protein
MDNQFKTCFNARNQVDSAKQAIIASEADAMSALATAAQDFVNAEAAIAKSGAEIASKVQQATAAQTKAQLEADLAGQTTTSSFGLYRVYHDYDTWRARALLMNARRYALAARRAIEARYVVDLSRLDQSEAFVAGPSSWAGDVFDYDLSMPSAVGLAVGDQSSSPAPGGIYVNKISDYVNNLRGFVSGYSATRPSAVSQDGLDVIALPGLTPGDPVSACATESSTSGSCEAPPMALCGDIAGAGASNCADSASGSGFTVSCCLPPAFVGLGDWQLHCPGPSGGADQWVPVPLESGDVDNACGAVGGPAHPDEARLDFSLDPWGRMNGSTGNVPFAHRYNVRWTKLAVNFVGTGVKNCTLAADPSDCYASEYIPFNLSHVGPTWVTDYNEQWRLLDVPTGQIEFAKALAAEIWLDPLRNGWSTDFIGTVARTEYELRPLGGAYVLDFPVGPEVVLANIQRVQILVGSTAWVKQQ